MHIVEKWVDIISDDLKCFKDKDKTSERLVAAYNSGILFVEEVAGGKGVVACFVMEDWFGNMLCNELIIYIKPEFRGIDGLFFKMVKIIERIAKDNSCKRIQLGASIGYKDDYVLEAYKSLGYKTREVSKECVQD